MTWGVWSELAGGFVGSAGLYTKEEANTDREHLINQGEDPADLEVIEECAEHDEQPADGCEECETETDEDDEDGDET